MPKRKLPPTEEVIELYRSGLSTGELAERWGVQPITVVSCLRSAGEPRRSASEADRISRANGRKQATRYWAGKKQPEEMVERRMEAIRGEKHYLWKGGKSRRPYREVVTKETCERCGNKDNLGVHHLDMDHFNNAPENLQVLCVSCHMSVHKQAYWDAIHQGSAIPRSNGPVGWTGRRCSPKENQT